MDIRTNRTGQSLASETGAGFRAGGAWRQAGESPEVALGSLFASDPGVRLRTMPGRETFHCEASGQIIKRYERDEPRDWWYERLRPGGPQSPGRREVRNLEQLRLAGIPVPRPLYWIEEAAASSRAGGRSVAVFEHVPHVADLRRLLEAEPARAAEFVAPLARAVADLHRTGWYHRDLYLHHWLVGADGALTLIDLARARRERAPRLRWFVKDLAALKLWLPDEVESVLVARFMRHWDSCAGVGPFSRRGRRRLGRAIAHKAERLGRHVPKTPDSIAEPPR